MTQTDLDRLLELARSVPMSSGDREQQRRSFAYGNTHIENTRITRKMVEDAADRVCAPGRNTAGVRRGK
ncbi:MAG: hypothetical protein M0R74_04360 [Dehalococcoidia bacterium]|nr:hypothetical protein [Dehalococcoidia bacterium]